MITWRDVIGWELSLEFGGGGAFRTMEEVDSDEEEEEGTGYFAFCVFFFGLFVFVFIFYFLVEKLLYKVINTGIFIVSQKQEWKKKKKKRYLYCSKN